MDDVDRAIINQLQGGFPICDHPFREAARDIGITEEALLQRLEALRSNRIISRFGPMYHAEKLGGALTLAAMRVPDADYERVTALVNAHAEVAHNYAREHDFNMWFVVATETPEQLTAVLTNIEAETGHPVYNMPKLEEFYLCLKFAV